MLVVAVERRESARGGFTTLSLGNRAAGSPTSPFWPEDQLAPRRHRAGVVARVTGEVGHYNGRRQLKVASLVALPPGAVDWRRLQPSVASALPTGPRWTAGGGRSAGPGSAARWTCSSTTRLPRALRGVPRQHRRPPRRARWPAPAYLRGRRHRPRHRQGLPAPIPISCWPARCCTTSASSRPTAGTAPSRPPSRRAAGPRDAGHADARPPPPRQRVPRRAPSAS